MSASELERWQRECRHEVVVRCVTSQGMDDIMRPVNVINTLTEWIVNQGLIPQRDFCLHKSTDHSARHDGFVQWTFGFRDPGIASLFKLTWGCRDL